MIKLFWCADIFVLFALAAKTFLKDSDFWQFLVAKYEDTLRADNLLAAVRRRLDPFAGL